MSPRADFAALFPVRECGCRREACEGWLFFDRLPRITWHQDSGWRRQVARACDDLGDDLVGGDWPMPRNNAEEIVLPRHGDDYDWDMCSEVLFQDHDVLMLYDESLDGIEDPGSDANEYLRMGDLRPAHGSSTSTTSSPATRAEDSAADGPAQVHPRPVRHERDLLPVRRTSVPALRETP
jgi:hypothetical protein